MRRRRCRRASQEISSEVDRRYRRGPFHPRRQADMRTFRDELGYVVDWSSPAPPATQRRPAARRAAGDRAGGRREQSSRSRGGRHRARQCGAEPCRCGGENFRGRGRRTGGERADAGGSGRDKSGSDRAPGHGSAETGSASGRRRAAGAKAGARATRRGGDAGTGAAQTSRGAACRGIARCREHAIAAPAPRRRRQSNKAALPRLLLPQPTASASSPPPSAAAAAGAENKTAAASEAAAASPPAQRCRAAAAEAKTTAPRIRSATSDSAGKSPPSSSEQGADLKLTFAFKTPVGAAVFQRADTLWLVFDAKAAIDLSALDGEPSRTIRSYRVLPFRRRRRGAAQARPSAAVERRRRRRRSGPSISATPSSIRPARSTLTRNLIGANRSSVSHPVRATPQHVYRIADPDVGDTLFVVTALAPARGIIAEQDFIEFHALASTQGVVIEPLADDLSVNLVPDKIVVTRPLGPDLVDIDADLDARLGAARGDVRFAGLGLRLARAPISSRQDRSHRRRRRGAAAPAPGAAARTGALLHRARHVSGSQGRARRRARRRAQIGREHARRWCCARSPK